MDEPTDRAAGQREADARDPHVDLDRATDPFERRTALALTAVLETHDTPEPRWTRTRSPGGPVRDAEPLGTTRAGLGAALADIQRRAGHQNRRRTAVGVLTAAAALALLLTAPSLVPAPVVGRPATNSVPSAGVPDAAPSPAGTSPLMGDAQVDALYPGANASGTTGSIGLGSRRASSTTIGGYCGDSPLEATEPAETWGATWQQPPGASGTKGARIREKVLRWEGPEAVEDVVRYTWATRGSTLECEGGTYGQPIVTEPGGAVFSEAVLAPGGALAPDGSRSLWRVRSISPAGDGLTVVELTVDVPAADGREAARSVQPLREVALSKAAPVSDRSSGDTAPAVLPPGPAGALSDRSSEVPRTGPTPPQPSPAWRAPLSDASTLTLQQVRSVVPAAMLPPGPVSPAATSRPAVLVPGCDGTASLPSGVTDAPDERRAAWTASDAEGRPVVDVSERVLRWGDWDPARSYVAGMSDAATACTTDPSDPVDLVPGRDRAPRGSTPWREVRFRSSDGATVEALVRPADADRPGAWVLRAASAPTAGTTAVEVQVTARAESPDALVGVMEPLLQAASERGAADQTRAFARGATVQPDVP